jgi:hypothetical protein
MTKEYSAYGYERRKSLSFRRTHYELSDRKEVEKVLLGVC